MVTIRSLAPRVNSLLLRQTFHHWRRGVRLYIALAILLVTLYAWGWAALSYGGSMLFATRLEEVYGWLSLGMLVMAISIGPLYSIWRRLPGRRIMQDARRLIGVGAGWFAFLHASIAYVALFKSVNPLQLPQAYQQAFVIGGAALLILAAMVFTSFDRAFHGMGIWWFRLHRLVYVAILLILLHIFSIGAHATVWPVLIILSVLALSLIGMHAYLAFVRPERPTTWQVLAVSYTALLLLALFNYGYGQKLGYNPIEGRNSGHAKTTDK